MVSDEENSGRLIVIGNNGQVFDEHYRQIAPRDAGFDNQYGDRSALGLVPNVMQVAQPCNNGQLCMTNSALLWHQIGGD